MIPEGVMAATDHMESRHGPAIVAMDSDGKGERGSEARRGLVGTAGGRRIVLLEDDRAEGRRPEERAEGITLDERVSMDSG